MTKIYFNIAGEFICLCFAFSPKIDAEKSVVNFKATALMVNSVHGTIKGMNGEINFDENNLAESSFNVCIDPATINTEIQKRDDHLKSEDFFFCRTVSENLFRFKYH